MNIDDICNIIKNETNVNNISVHKNTYNYNKSNPANELLKYGIVDNTDTKYTELKLKHKNTICAECRFCLISNTIGYIHSIEVDKSLQNKSIGSNIIKYIIKDISSDTIYIYPTNRVIKHICQKQGFKKVSKPSGWYCKNC